MRKGEFNIQGMLAGVLIIGFFFSLVASFVTLNGANYDTTGYTESQISDYTVMQNISDRIQSAKGDVETVTVDRGVFDFFADIFNKIVSPFKTVYGSIIIMYNLGDNAVRDLNLLPIAGEFIATFITILVIIGIVMIKYYLNKSK